MSSTLHIDCPWLVLTDHPDSDAKMPITGDQTQQQGQSTSRNSMASSVSSASSSANLIKRKVDDSRRDDTLAKLKTDSVMSSQIRMGI